MRAVIAGVNRWRSLVPLGTGLIVTLLTGIVLLAIHHSPRPAVPPRLAVSAALRDPQARRALAGSHWTGVAAEALDRRTEHVSFFSHDQIVADVLVQPGGHVVAGVDTRALRVPYGNWVAYQPALVLLFSAVFVLMAGVAPWRRLRNLDVVVALSLVASVLLFQRRYLDPSLLLAALAMVYLLLRCISRALMVERPASPSVPLLTALTPRLSEASRIRWLRVSVAALALVVLMISVSSTDPVDVIYAVMQGATRLVHGVLPYGHMPPGIVHGDTYPIFTYGLYAPVALVAPVTTIWDSVDGGLAVAALAALLSAWAVFRSHAGARLGARLARTSEDEAAGLRAAAAWLAFPPLLITASTGTTDVVLAAMLAVALLLWRRPAACAGMLAAAGWFKLAPFALLPVCLAPLRGRRLGAAVASIVLVSAPLIGLLVALGGVRGPTSMLHAISYQFSRGSEQSFWSALGIAGLQPLGQACVLGLIAGAAMKLRQEPDLARDRARMAALAAAILIALQLAADYWAFLYLVWVMPLVSLSVLGDVRAASMPVGSRAVSARGLRTATATAR